MDAMLVTGEKTFHSRLGLWCFWHSYAIIFLKRVKFN
ncbi:MAG: hypothetical protein JWR26_4297 [Pedosphaera sp.]|nr:hypothetical protein [Pedosphaera sp.]